MVAAMALRRALEMLKAGEQINDLLYRSTLKRNSEPPGRRWMPAQLGALKACPGCTRLHGARSGVSESALHRRHWLAVQPAT
jgi:hypothetical protein